MPDITILTESELSSTVRLDRQAIETVESAFARLAGGEVIMPPILSMAIKEQNGEVDIKTAYVPGFNGFAIKISPGFFDNPAKGLPSLNGLMVLLDSQTGIVKAVLLDNGYLTNIRTAAAGAVAAKHLAPENIETAGVLGGGMQARLQMQALKLVRDFGSLRIWDIDKGTAGKCADELAALLDIDVTVCDSIAEVIKPSQVVVTTTPARVPLIEVDMLHPGLHITAMGSDAAEKNEIAPQAIAIADLYVPDRQSQTALLGELHHALEAGFIADDKQFPELGGIISGQAQGRAHADQITIADLTGTGVQDTAIADLAYKKCIATEIGTVIIT